MAIFTEAEVLDGIGEDLMRKARKDAWDKMWASCQMLPAGMQPSFMIAVGAHFINMAAQYCVMLNGMRDGSQPQMPHEIPGGNEQSVFIATRIYDVLSRSGGGLESDSILKRELEAVLNGKITAP